MTSPTAPAGATVSIAALTVIVAAGGDKAGGEAGALPPADPPAVVETSGSAHSTIRPTASAGRGLPVAARVRNAGAVFVGTWAPVSLGDYCAGSNHVLPTGGCAVHSSGLSVQSFLRGIHVVHYDEAALREVGAHVVALARAEDLPGHGDAVIARLPELG